MSKWLVTIHLVLIIFGVSAEEPQYVRYYWDEPGSWTVCDVEGYIRQTALEFDSKGVAHVLYTHERPHGLRLYYTSNETGEFSDPVPLLLMETGCQMMESRIGWTMPCIWSGWMKPIRTTLKRMAGYIT